MFESLEQMERFAKNQGFELDMNTLKVIRHAMAGHAMSMKRTSERIISDSTLLSDPEKTHKEVLINLSTMIVEFLKLLP
jgi:hypothetical protein